ncbi:MAG: putative quinol monooxygenase [Stellaceae bacterium]
MRLVKRILPLAVLGLLAGAPAYADSFNEVDVVTHIDLIPDASGNAPPAAVTLLKQFVTDSRKEKGVEYFTLITWSPTTNHFQLIEIFRNDQAFATHVSAAHTVTFRDKIQQYIGAPYDERLYRPVF